MRSLLLVLLTTPGCFGNTCPHEARCDGDTLQTCAEDTDIGGSASGRFTLLEERCEVACVERYDAAFCAERAVPAERCDGSRESVCVDYEVALCGDRVAFTRERDRPYPGVCVERATYATYGTSDEPFPACEGVDEACDGDALVTCISGRIGQVDPCPAACTTSTDELGGVHAFCERI